MADPTGMESRRLGLAAFDRGEVPTAARALRERVALAPTDIEALCKLAVSLSRLGQHQEAVQTAELAGRLAGDQPYVQFHRGIVLAGAGRSHEAIAAFESVTRMEPRNADAAAWLRSLQSRAPRPLYRSRQAIPHSAPPGLKRDRRLLAGLAARKTLRNTWIFMLILGYGSWQIALRGAQIEREERSSLRPVVVSYEEFIQNMPRSGWYRVTGAALDVVDANWLVSSGVRREVTSLYVPVRPADERSEGPVRLLLATDDQSIQETLREIEATEGKPLETDAYAKQNVARIWLRGDIEGVIRSGEPGSPANRQFEEFRGDLASDYRVLNHNQRLTGEGRWFYWFGVGGLAALAVVLLGLIGAIIVTLGGGNGTDELSH